jgi:hypothetical protein
MALTSRDLSLLWRRTQEWFNALKREARAAGTCPSYCLEDLRTLVEKCLARSVCSYCRHPLTVTTMALAHKTPIARGGRFTLRNLEVCCPECQLLLGLLDTQEYRELRLLVATWPRPVQTRFLASLRTVQELAQPLPRIGPVEAFTPADQAIAHDPNEEPCTLLSGNFCHEMSHG